MNRRSFIGACLGAIAAAALPVAAPVIPQVSVLPVSGEIEQAALMERYYEGLNAQQDILNMLRERCMAEIMAAEDAKFIEAVNRAL